MNGVGVVVQGQGPRTRITDVCW